MKYMQKSSSGRKRGDYGLISTHCFYKNSGLEIQKNISISQNNSFKKFPQEMIIKDILL